MNKIAAYGIVKNEIKFIERCIEAIKDADYICLMDTGSTDGTLEKLNELKSKYPQLIVNQRIIEPWRFDTARNASMEYIPEDANIIISVDADDVWPSNWRQIVEEDFEKGYNKILCSYTYYDNATGVKGNTIYLDRVSKRNVTWKGALHEGIHYIDEEENIIHEPRIVVEHRQDLTKSRDYFSVIEAAANPSDTYSMLCYGYELFNKHYFEKGIAVFGSIFDLNSEYTTRKWVVMVAEKLIDLGRLEEATQWYEAATHIQRQGSVWEDGSLYDGRVERRLEELQNTAPNYKIAVYAICGNEAHNVDSWMQSMWEADYICVLDTGSTDGSYEKLQEWQKNNPEKVFIDQKTYNPWRFDTPRNDSMKLVPADADICICTDLDERLTPTWANKIRRAWNPNCERGYYLYAWSHMQDGSPARVFWYDKIHKNSGFWQWKYPVHECLMHPIYGASNLDKSQIARLPSDFIMLHHYPTFKEGRSNYLPLLEMRAREYPEDFYGLVYLAHEYKYQKQYKECIDFIYTKVFPALLDGNDVMNCKPDLYMFLGDCYLELKEETEAETNYRAAIAFDATFRDPYLRLAKLLVSQNKNEEALDVMNDCFKYSRHQYSWLEGDGSWHSEPWDILCIIYWNLGAIDMSYQCAKLATIENPSDPRLQDNLKILEQNMKHN